ncbi:MAG TPA: selenide, water dikinase SelD [Gemmatimonadaceae bacterium]
MNTSDTREELVHLTAFARCAGCASKMGPGDLSQALAPLPHQNDPRLLVGSDTFDDAGVFRLSDDLALVQTVDFFAPIVDDPYEFGQIAAANALSDVYAMGGEPLTALCIVGFPTGSLPIEVLTAILRGAQDKVHEAGAVVVGGHTVVDEEPKFGLAVTGRANPHRLLTNANARPGDVLVLTKAIGTGILATAGKRGSLDSDTEHALRNSMCRLNAAAARAALEVGARCATDVTGFGLLGHASHIARASDVTIQFTVSQIPLLPRAREFASDGVGTAGAKRNEEFVAGRVDWGGGAVTNVDRALLVDPQTSGGLLVTLRRDVVADYLSRVDGATEIGTVRPRGPFDIVLT